MAQNQTNQQSPSKIQPEYPDKYEIQTLNPVAATALALFKENFTNPKMLVSAFGRPILRAVALWDLAGGTFFTSTNPLLTGISNGVTTAVVTGSSFNSGLPAGGALAVNANMYVLNEGLGQIEMLRTPSWVYSVACTAAGNTVLVPAVVGKKHRVLGVICTPTAGLAAAGTETVEILDVAAQFGTGGIIFSPYLPIAAGIIPQPSIAFTGIGNGFLTAAVNTVINCNLSAAATAGSINIMIWGDDE